MSLSFFDSNVILYSDDAALPEKQECAISLIAGEIRNRNAVISTQVLNEYFVNATRKLKIDAAAAQRKVENLLTSMTVAQTTGREIVEAIKLHRLDRISYWDALIVTTATNVKAGVLYSEDLQSGRKFGTLKVINPFTLGTI